MPPTALIVKLAAIGDVVMAMPMVSALLAKDPQTRITWMCGHTAAGLVTVSVASDGVPIPPDVERHLFEPFFSTRSRGSGLGLYICRELCERHGASMGFSLAPPGARRRTVFSVAMRAQDAGPADSTTGGNPVSPSTAPRA